MWVDDNFPGYRDLLNRYAAIPQDTNPNRTRDNLDTLKYSLRSVAAFMPWIRHIYIVCCAPQKPRWMAQETPGLTIVHHDAIMDPAILPTFNSFAIQSHLHRIPGLSRRFVQFDDDVLLAAPMRLADFLDPRGRLRVFHRLGHTPRAALRNSDRLSPWNASLAQSNHLLDEAFGFARRPTFTHAPLFIDQESWKEMIARWPEDFARTRASRFRAKHNVVPDYLYPHFLVATERGAPVPLYETYRDTYYLGIENYLAYVRYKFAIARRLRPKTICLNDNFGPHPKPSVVEAVREFLEKKYPVKSVFER
jgi:hypothetical protein